MIGTYPAALFEKLPVIRAVPVRSGGVDVYRSEMTDDQTSRMRGKTSSPNIVNLSVTASEVVSAVWKNRSRTPTPASSRQRLI